MNKTLLAALAAVTLIPPARADDLGFDGKLVEPDCATMSPWFNCRDITTLDPANPAHQSILRGYQYMHHSSTTLGPDGNTRHADTGEPYASSVTA
jgi:hypothetical protein